MASKGWAFLGCAAANLYLLGAMLLFATVSYPQLGAVEPAAFPAAYQAFTAWIPLRVVVWEFAAVLLTVPLYFTRPPAVRVGAVHALMVLGLTYFAITFGWHLPAHRALAAGDNSPSALEPLLLSQWVRTGVQALKVGLLAGLVRYAFTRR